MMNLNEVIEISDTKHKTKRRGRPRKNDISTPKQKASTSQNEVEEDIILNLHISTTDIKNENMNGYEIIQTECCEPTDESNSNLSDDTDENRQKLLQIIQEKNKIISDLETKLKQTSDITRISESNKNTISNISLHILSNPFETTDTGKLIIPEHTKMACLWDTCEINGTPCFLPDSYNDNTFYVIGWFCSINCATAYNLWLDDFKTSERYSLLKWLYRRSRERIDPAPPSRILDKYGGKFTIHDYRKNFIKCEKDILLMTPPLTFISQSISERCNEVKHKKKIRVI